MKLSKKFMILLLSIGVAGMASALDEVDRLEMRAEMAFANGEYDLAIQRWSEAIKLSPNESSIYMNRAVSYAAKKEVEKQLADYAEVIRIDPDNLEAHQLRAKFYHERMMDALRKVAPYDSADTDNAIADDEQVVRIRLAGEKDPGAAAREASKKAMEQWDFTLALACWKAVAKLDSKDAEAWFRIALLEELLLKPDNAKADCDEALRLDPKHVDAATLRAQIDAGWKWENDSHPFNQGDKHQTAGDYEKAVADSNLRIWLGGKEMAANYSQRARAYSDWGKWEKAVVDYTEALRVEKTVYKEGIYEGRGYAYVKGGKYDDAAADFLKAAEAWHSGQASEYADASERRTAESMESENFIAAQFLIRAAEAYMRGGKYEKAIALLKGILKTDSKNTWAMDALAWVYATCPDARFRNGSEAVRLASQAGLGESYYSDTMAAAFAETGRWEEAVMTEKAAIDDAREYMEKVAANPKNSPSDIAKWKKEDEEWTKELTGRLLQYEKMKPCREMKEFEFGG